MKPEAWMKWDLYSKQDHATTRYLLWAKNGGEAYGVFVSLVERMYLSDTGWLPNDESTDEVVGSDLKMRSKAITPYRLKLIELGLFITDEGGRFASKRGLRERDIRTTRSQKLSDAGKKGAAITNSYSARPQPPRSHPETPVRPRAADKRRLDKIRSEEINTNTARARDPSPAVRVSSPSAPVPSKLDPKKFDYPETLKTPKVQAAMVEWLEYKKKRGESYKDPRSLAKLWLHWAPLGADQLVEAINRSIRNNWAGLFEEKSTKPPYAYVPVSAANTVEKNMEYIKKRMHETRNGSEMSSGAFGDEQELDLEPFGGGGMVPGTSGRK